MPHLALPLDRASLPQGAGAAVWRGVRGKCPRCGGTHLFAGFLKPVERCRMCGQNWTLHGADDFPPYIAIILTGHIMAPVIIELGLNSALPAWAMMLIVASLALVLIGSILQPAKGGVIALQWWLGLNGFAGKAGRDEAAPR
ncbi:MAG: hypothetical protein B7Y36_17630 [Novosphingobium sp. 28-62-57]|uniref:DUF983 domain-containing protein n=1 Tax=unclassified Novosphingobium TaxID=2644732 RepID=UPI000BDCD078|nr:MULTISPECIES: DUF983 domain-containing protein [unclassified Novosphingobium]OYW48714.1 MAG: hypothetical protein B7Z34_12495 [Novosphingobium sp. 12-62-10]OYZ08301.1 MAG: hypothetical protein B7Y36_17630 [Novosphingobium sp. 28-62-57]OZA35859.1 MAG: hypothetical protein B7X92_08675 [Novosphingobium sp. 17-62-9]HQS69402.1 DUF983 domain-containing protein [Novosphingobium sp.]